MTPLRHSFPEDKAVAIKTALARRDPFYVGTCSLPSYQRCLYYANDDITSRIDLFDAGLDKLEGLYHACRPAANVLEESYRKMNLVSFSTLFDPRQLGIYKQVYNALPSGDYGKMEIELFKLNVYGKGDFSKNNNDTPRGQNLSGSLLVVFPTPHDGGRLVLRQGEQEWTIDFAERFAATKEPSVCFVAFYDDVRYEVLPVTSGHLVMLAYKLYHEPLYPSPSSILTPCQLAIKRALVDLICDPSVLPDGGHLGFGLVHEYVYKGRNLLDHLPAQLKGPDRALADVCDVLGLTHSLKFLYRNFGNYGLHVVTTKELDFEACIMDSDPESSDYMQQALEGMTIEEAEIVSITGEDDVADYDIWDWCQYALEAFYRVPFTEVMEITPMKSSVSVKSPIFTFGNEMTLEYVYGTACMLVRLDPAESRQPSRT